MKIQRAITIESKMKRNINLDYLFCFMKNFDIASAIWVLYMVYRGLPLWQIGLVEGIFHVTSFLFEVPSGALSDLIGRKKVIIIGRICSAVAALVQLFSTNFIGFSIGFIISALSYNLNSGSEEALVYDSLKYLGKEERYIGISGRLNTILELARAIATFLGGVLAEYSYTWCYITVILIALLSLIPALMFEETTCERTHTERVDWKIHFKTCKTILKESAAIRKILVYYPIVTTFATSVYFYGQEFYSQAGYNKIEISIIMLVSGACSCAGALSSEKLLSIFGEKTKYLASILMGISILLVSCRMMIISIPFFAVMNFVHAVLYPIQSASLNALIPSEQRATLISIDSMFFSLSMILFFPLSGWIADQFSLTTAFWVLGVIQLVMMLILLYRKKEKK